ncbi:MAG TPA: hypothetical protein VFI15_06850 [Candidatus Limnocylindrales bacterium]|nr:hypothetical protein [Candidatus Limnocylindrales bacterium]
MQKVVSTATISGALGDVDVRALAPCTLNGSIGDISFVLISLQKINFPGEPTIVQIGYARCSYSGGCHDIPSDGKQHFVFTQSDQGSGAPYLADGWYKAPVTGHRYRMKVEATTHSGDSVWQYCIKDVTLSEGYVCHFEPRTWTNGVFSWWGTEVTNDRSQNGTRAIDPDIELEGQYKSSGSWFIRSGADNDCFHDSDGFYPTYYGCLVTNSDKQLWSYTFDH